MPRGRLCECVYSVSQLCLTLCDPVDCSQPSFSVHEIFQARILEQVAISSFRGSSQPRDRTWVFSIGRWFLYHWAIWEAIYIYIYSPSPPPQHLATSIPCSSGTIAEIFPPTHSSISPPTLQCVPTSQPIPLKKPLPLFLFPLILYEVKGPLWGHDQE